VFNYSVTTECAQTHARNGVFETPHGSVQTPAFMPVGTKATVKGIQPAQLRELGAEMVLANTYHLHLRPGEDVVRDLGGLHQLMGWNGPILTDSGGYQVFSLSDTAKIDDDGVTFRSVIDGAKVRFTPERVMEIQHALGADVVMAFDECPPDPLDRPVVEKATNRTHNWLVRCVRSWRERGGVESGQALFGIVQGGGFEDLRHAAVDTVVAHDLPGYAVGGVSVGEDREVVNAAVAAAAPRLPKDKPRYLMGVGTPSDFVNAIAQGIDLFDCVTPTRHGRTHQAFTSTGRLNLRNARFIRDTAPLDEDCDCPTCLNHSRGYLRHLATTGEMLGPILLTVHNLRYFHRLMEDIRTAISAGNFHELQQRVLAST
jgi:queuine tRNA-ribosyltransferase